MLDRGHRLFHHLGRYRGRGSRVSRGEMMRVRDDGTSILLWASENDTYDWAHRSGNSWPCSTLNGHRFFAGFDSDGLYELTVDGKHSETVNIDGYELSACCADLIEQSGKVSPDNTAYFVAVTQHTGS